MSTNYIALETTRREYIDFGITQWGDTEHGYLTGPLGIVAALLTVRPPEPADPLLGRWCGGQLAVTGIDYTPDYDGNPSLYERTASQFEDITPAVVVMFERLGIAPVQPSVIEALREGRLEFQRFARCALVIDYLPVAEFLTHHLGSGWPDTFRTECERAAGRPPSDYCYPHYPQKRFETYPE